jgi:hypothetical protein
VAFLVVAGIVLITLSAVALVLRIIARQTMPLVACATGLGLLLGFIALAYALPKM